MHDTYSSPLSDRYASRAMLELWSPRKRFGVWRRLWLALAEAEKQLGVAIPDVAIEQMRDNLDNFNFDVIAAYERRFRHDVVAHLHAFGDVAPLAKPFIHLGATSAFLTDNADLILMRRGLELLRGRILGVLRPLATFASQWKDEPTLGYTHLQPAQLTTVGKRATLWIQDLLLDLGDLDRRVSTLPLRGVKGTTGTQASFLEIFGGDHDKVRQIDRLVTSMMDFQTSLAVTGQTYTRKIDASVLSVVAGIAASAAKFSGDIRMLQSFGEMEEPFEDEQVGSSAMPYKRNPMRSERIAGLARFVLSLEPNANQTHSVQFFERTLDDSSNRRLVIPEAFLATEAILLLMTSIVSGLDVRRNRIAQRVKAELPFMATERLIVRAVRKGVDRQEAHEMIRRHSVESWNAMNGGSDNDLLERLAADSSLQLGRADIDDAADPGAFTGRASKQVDEFLAEVLAPVLSQAADSREEGAEIRV